MDSATGEIEGSWKYPGTSLFSLWNPVNELIAENGDPDGIRFVDSRIGGIVQSVRLPADSYEAAWSNAHILIVGLTGGVVAIDILNANPKVQTLAESSIDAQSVAISSRGVVAAMQNEEILIITPDETNVHLEHHTGYVDSLSFSHDGELLASSDPTVEWQSGERVTGNCYIVGHGTQAAPISTFHLPSVQSNAYSHTPTSTELRSTTAALSTSTFYTTAKVALVGDSGVGKTGLGWVLTHDEFKNHPSTHGEQFWIAARLSKTRSDGTQCEAIVWDLAGQPDYRLIHSLFIDDADVALVVFDPTNTQEPLKGVQFWLRALRARREGVSRDSCGRAHGSRVRHSYRCRIAGICSSRGH